MAFELRGYQGDMIAEARGLLRVHNSIVLQAATGAGKTALASYMLGSASKRGRRGWFICHRAELVEQTAKTFDKVGIDYGFIASGQPLNPDYPVQICSIDTLKGRIGRYAPPDLIVWDEAHHTAAAGWRRVKDEYCAAKHVGLTATPERLDGKGLDDLFTGMVKGPPVRWLIDNGYLSTYRAFAPPVAGLDNLPKRMGDVAVGAAEAAMNKPTITGDAVSHYMRLAAGKSAVVFCVTVKHSQEVAAAFRAAGIEAAHLDGSMRQRDPVGFRQILEAFKRGEIKVLCSVDLFGEGFDLPSLEVSILLRPTHSLALYLQQVGRCLRTAPGKNGALILDHAGNISKHGLPDDEHDWSLQGRKAREAARGEAAIPMRQCPKCYCAHPPASKCPECNHVYVVQDRKPEYVDDELVEVDQTVARQRRAIENRTADSLAELIHRGRERKYKNAVLWAAHYHLSIKGKDATLNGLMDYAQREGKPNPVQWAGYVLSRVLRK